MNEGGEAGCEGGQRNPREAFLAVRFLKQRLLGEITRRSIPTGARPQPRVHFQRRALRLPENTSYSDLTAFLTAAGSPSEVDSFPYLRGLDGNGTGNQSGLSFEAGRVFWSLPAGRECEGKTGRRTGVAGGAQLLCAFPFASTSVHPAPCRVPCPPAPSLGSSLTDKVCLTQRLFYNLELSF